jgi:hypothetical protein
MPDRSAPDNPHDPTTPRPDGPTARQPDSPTVPLTRRTSSLAGAVDPSR